jgi:hypothetical protein
MEKNKRRLAARLFWLALGAVCVPRAAGYILEIREARASITRCREALRDAPLLPAGRLSRLESRLAELRARETPEEAAQTGAQTNPRDPAGRIRDALRAHAIGVERFRTLSTGGAGAAEFTLSGAPVNFLRFLQGAADLPLPLGYISIKPNVNASALDITVRFNHAQ